MIPGIFAAQAASAGGGTELWTPDALSPVLYLDSREGVGAVALKPGGGRVQSWTDQGTSGASFSSENSSPDVGPKPGLVNGLRSVFFDSSDSPDALGGNTAARGLLNNSSEYTLAVVALVKEPDANIGALAYWSMSSAGVLQDGTRLRVDQRADGQIYAAVRNTDGQGAAELYSGGSHLNSPLVTVITMNRGGDAYKMRMGGLEVDADSLGSTSTGSRSHSAIARLGRWGTSTNIGWANAHLLSVVLLDKIPSNENIEKLEGWAAWAFQGNGSDADFVGTLRADHPYKDAPPYV